MIDKAWGVEGRRPASILPWTVESGKIPTDGSRGIGLDLLKVGVTALLAIALSACAPAPVPPAIQDRPEQQLPVIDLAAQVEPGAEDGPPGHAHLPGADGSARFALVFGNGAYRHGDALAAPARDAALIARALNERGYHVMLGLDRDLAGMREDIAAFQEMSRDADLRLLYFAGHGFEFDHANYLMPVDLPTSITEISEQQVRYNALRLDQLVWELERDAPVLVAVVDACRIPPSRGPAELPTLAAEQAPEGAILAFATAPGRVAMDSLRAYGVDEEHSPYSYYLASALASPDVETWDQAFAVTYNIVNDRTRGAQQPWMNARVNRFPPVGPLQTASANSSWPLADFRVSPEREAAGRYWANEANAAARLAADRSTPDTRLKARADDGEARAALALATRWFEEPGKEQDVIALLQPLAEQGNATAQTDLGTMLHALAAEDGQGRSARYWWAQASAQGVGEARAKLAIADGDPAAASEVIRGMWEHFKSFQPRIEEFQ